LYLIVQGKTNKEIARSLGLGEGTVKIHVAALFGKLGRKNSAVIAADYTHKIRCALHPLHVRYSPESRHSPTRLAGPFSAKATCSPRLDRRPHGVRLSFKRIHEFAAMDRLASFTTALQSAHGSPTRN